MSLSISLMSAFRIIPISSLQSRPSVIRAASTAGILDQAYGIRLSKTDAERLITLDDHAKLLKDAAAFKGEKFACARTMFNPLEARSIDPRLYRFAQTLHYLSTYGFLNFYLKDPHWKGWLPKQAQIPDPHRKAQKILESELFTLMDETQWPSVVANRVCQQNRRLSQAELEAASVVIEKWPECFQGLQPAFKENIYPLFAAVLDAPVDALQRVDILKGLCAHPGDVLKCMNDYLDSRTSNAPGILQQSGKKTKDRKLSTSQKRTVIRLLETYPPRLLEENLVGSRTVRERNMRILGLLSPMTLFRSAPHKAAFMKMQKKQLHSWQSLWQKQVETDLGEAIKMAAARPGFLLRNLSLLLLKGAREADLQQALMLHAKQLSVRQIADFAGQCLPGARPVRRKDEKEEDWQRRLERAPKLNARLLSVVMPVLKKRLELLETPIRGKKIFLDAGSICLEDSLFDAAGKPDGQYIRSGMSYKIPDEAKTVRFFVYWNDSKRIIDLDLHTALVRDGICRGHIGWNGDQRHEGIYLSGDMTTNDSAEFIDIDLDQCKSASILAEIDSYLRVPFDEIDTCFIGLCAIPKLQADMPVYDPANCLMAMYLRLPEKHSGCARIDTAKRTLHLLTHKASRMDWVQSYSWNCTTEEEKILVEDIASGCYDGSLPLMDYLNMLFAAQNAVLVDDPDEADRILCFGRAENDKMLSLTDENFFADACVSSADSV